MTDQGQQVTPQQLLTVLADQLSTGEALLTEQHFVDALAKVDEQLTGEAPSESRRSELTGLIRETNEKDPTILLVPGVENWIARTVLAQFRKANWGITEVQERGNQAVRDFAHGPQATALLAQLGVDVRQVNQRNCLRSIVNTISGRHDDSHRNAEARLAQLQASIAAAAPTEEGEDHEHHRRVLSDLLLAPVEDPSDDEINDRQASQKQERNDLRKTQMTELVANLENYVKLGRISAEDAEKMSKAHRVDEAIRQGKVDKEKGSKIRNSVMDGTARDRVERSVKEALDYAVVYLQVFHSLGRIESRFDPALKFLIRHGTVINADAGDKQTAELGDTVRALIEDIDVLRLLIDLMDRKDAEVRMIGARLPPYSHIVRRDQGRVERVAVTEEFIDQLRQLSPDDLAAQLHSGDKRERARPAAAMITMTVLLGRLIKPTPVRKEIRLLKVNLIVEEFYRSTDDLDQARGQAQEFLRTRLKSLYPDLSQEETAAMQEQGERILAAVEEKIVAERAARGELPGAPGGDDDDDDEAETLGAEEKGMGVQIHRISVRVAGSFRQIPQKIMPDPEDAERFIIVQKDPESGELVPARRRGAKRYVIKGREGWELDGGS
ncbi:MAG: hypothetical protein HN404_19040 [Gemmatimonadetes bacterium]|nr:hypothetical protein [Gemmatimonadota bacterium]